MGRNNRARRQQKQRQKQSKQKKSSSTSQKIAISRDELITLCDPLITSMTIGDPPPPSIMGEWATYPISAAAQPLRSLLIGFINYLFHDDAATGDLSQLLPHRRGMKQAGLAWLYPILHVYCLISNQALVEGDVDALAIVEEPIPFDIKLPSNNAIERLRTPFYLLLWVLGRPVESDSNLHIWLHNWLYGSPLGSLLLPLKKFLKLKHPKPEQKTVKALETALTNITLHEQDGWTDGLRQLLTLFLQRHLSAAKRQSLDWQQYPQLSFLGGLVDTPTAPTWSRLTFSDTNNATLNRLNRVDTTSMPYTERLSLEAFRCRILSRYANCEVGERDFECQLEQAIHLMSVGVPPEHSAFAEHCLAITCEWLAQEVGGGRLSPPTTARLRRLSRLRPDDYRVALLTYLARGRRNSTAKNTDDVVFQHIHFPLFFRALNQACKANDLEDNTILNRFFWPLTGEAKKALYIQCCQKLLLGMNEHDAEDFWNRWRHPLFDTTKDPFNAIVKGQACEADMLFYTTIAAVDTGYGTAWLQADQFSSLIRSAEQLLSKHASHFNQNRVVALLTSLATHQDATDLFQSWKLVITLIRRIKCLNELVTFLRLALTTLHRQGDCAAEYKQALYTLCRPLPALRQYLPSQNASIQRPKKITKQSKTEKTLANLDLFGDPS